MLRSIGKQPGESVESVLEKRPSWLLPYFTSFVFATKAVTRGCFGCLNTPEISGKN